MTKANVATLAAGAFAFALGSAGMAAPQQAPASEHQEWPKDAWRPWERPEHMPVPSAGAALLGAFGIVQVNVDERGQNIPGDAANEPSIAVDPTDAGRIAIGWRQFDTIRSSFRQAGWAWTQDGGGTWTFPGVIQPGVFRSDPVLSFDSQGSFYYLSLDTQGGFNCDVFISGNEGASWDGGHFAYGGDKAWFTVDRSGSPGDGHVYHVWSPFYSCCNDACCARPGFFTRSSDGGLSWLDPIDLPLDIYWGTLSAGPDGELYVIGRMQDQANFVTRSSNASNAFEQPLFEQTVEVDLGGGMTSSPDDGPNPAGLLGQLWVATDHSPGPRRGRVYALASVDPPGDDPRDVMFASSSDGGFTWTPPLRLNDDAIDTNAWQWFGTMSVAPNGRIDVVFCDTRASGVPNVSELHYTRSSDGGATWTANVPISPPFDSWVGWPQQNKLGDYYDMISDVSGAHLAWAATFNGEQDVYYTRIEVPACDADVTGDGVVDVQDLTAVVLAWGACAACPEDTNGDSQVNVQDLTAVILQWGACG